MKYFSNFFSTIFGMIVKWLNVPYHEPNSSVAISKNIPCIERSKNNSREENIKQNCVKSRVNNSVDDNYVEVGFVMSDDPNCCKSYDIRAHRRCKSKYCIGKMMQKIVKWIDSAENSIYIAMYNLNNHRFIKSILMACSRGVDVKMISDKWNLLDNQDSCNQIMKFKAAGN